MRRIAVTATVAIMSLLLATGSALACGSLVAENGAVQLVRTSTLAAYHDGIEHYITSFEFAGGTESFGSIIPLPAEPTEVERGGDWTLQRLQREVAPVPTAAPEAFEADAAAGKVEVLLETRIESLDVTILRGGGRAVAEWAADNDFTLTDDTPEVLEFYAQRSPYFMAARFDQRAAVAQGLGGGDGIPVHLTIPVKNPWVPLRILATGKPADEIVRADVFLLTDREPTLLHGDGVNIDRSEPASTSLLDDLRSDTGMGWVPEEAWLTFAQVNEPVRDLTYDLAIDAAGGTPDVRDAGALPLLALVSAPTEWRTATIVVLLAAAVGGLLVVTRGRRIRARA